MTHFPAKILLFGEYTIINGGSAIAMPLNKHNGYWKPAADTTLEGFFEHIKTIPGSDKEEITKAINQKWQFESTIPMGYGLGSSGALSAAAYAAFFPTKTEDLADLKAVLSHIESYFHGKSSDLDPLTCYTQEAVLVDKAQISLVKNLALPPQLKLYDSGIARNGKPLIKYYNDRLAVDESFDETVLALGQKNERIIEELLEGKEITQSFKEISDIQYTHFKHMIPAQVEQIWAKGLKEDSYYMKLSGAGGGGYFLVLCQNDTISGFESIEKERH